MAIMPFQSQKKKKPLDRIAAEDFPKTAVIVLVVFSLAVIIIGIRQVKDTLTFQSQAQQQSGLDSILQGLMMLEDQQGLSVTSEQARRIFPRLMHFQGYTDVFRRFEAAVSASLDDKQKDFILSTSGQSFEPGGRQQIPQGYGRIQWIYSVLSTYSAGTSTPNTISQNADTGWLNRTPGLEDVCEGLFRLYKKGRLTKPEAAYLLPFISDIGDAYKTMETKGKTEALYIETVLNEKQMAFIRSIETPPAPDYARKNLGIIIMLLKERQNQKN
jgi:hypothetical protein